MFVATRENGIVELERKGEEVTSQLRMFEPLRLVSPGGMKDLR